MVCRRKESRNRLRAAAEQVVKETSIYVLVGISTSNPEPSTLNLTRSWMIFFAASLLLAWIVGFLQGGNNFSASTGCLKGFRV